MSIDVTRVETGRLGTAVRKAGDDSLPPLLLLHGNVSSSVFFEDLMRALADLRSCIAPDFRGYGDSEVKPIDATRGVRDFSDDVRALVEAMRFEDPVDIVAWSAGGGVAMQYAIDHPDSVRSLVLESAMSPYGFGGTRGTDGSPVWPDFAGSGGGTANPQFVERLAAADRSEDDPVTPRNVMNSFYFRPPFRVSSDDEERFVTAMLRMAIGDDVYPGDTRASKNWPGVAPGTSGMNNAIAPKYLDLSGFASIEPRPDVLWIRGADDQIVSDTSFFDFGYLGSLGAVPGWPGEDAYPPQPMVSQLRATLDEYRDGGGNYREVVYEDCGHSPHLECADRFVSDVRSFLEA